MVHGVDGNRWVKNRQSATGAEPKVCDNDDEQKAQDRPSNSFAWNNGN